MKTKRTIIGTGVGSVICVIGAISLVLGLGIQSIDVDESLQTGKSTTFEFNAPDHAAQFLEITGNAFHVTLLSPNGGLQIPGEDYKNELSLEWVHLDDGISRLEIQNTGDSELQLKGTFEVSSDPIMITYHIMVITAGVVIIGFSAGFSIRKPRGF